MSAWPTSSALAECPACGFAWPRGMKVEECPACAWRAKATPVDPATPMKARTTALAVAVVFLIVAALIVVLVRS